MLNCVFRAADTLIYFTLSAPYSVNNSDVHSLNISLTLWLLYQNLLAFTSVTVPQLCSFNQSNFYIYFDNILTAAQFYFMTAALYFMAFYLSILLYLFTCSVCLKIIIHLIFCLFKVDLQWVYPIISPLNSYSDLQAVLSPLISAWKISINLRLHLMFFCT